MLYLALPLYVRIVIMSVTLGNAHCAHAIVVPVVAWAGLPVIVSSESTGPGIHRRHPWMSRVHTAIPEVSQKTETVAIIGESKASVAGILDIVATLAFGITTAISVGTRTS